MQQAKELKTAKVIEIGSGKMGVLLENVDGEKMGLVLGPNEAFELLNAAIGAMINLPPVAPTADPYFKSFIEFKMDSIDFAQELGPDEVQVQILCGGLRLMLSTKKSELLSRLHELESGSFGSGRGTPQ